MKKGLKISLIVIAVLAASFVLFRLATFWLPYQKYNVNYFNVRAYTGDRVTVHCHVTVDGKPAIVTYADGSKLSDENGMYTLAARANDYDVYEYALKIQSKDISIPLKLTVKHWNWWEIMESDLYIDINTKDETYSTHESYGFTAEFPIYHYKTATQAKKTVKGIQKIKVTSGPKG